MSQPPAPARDGVYEHRYHAGNVADVFKHIALVAWLDRLRAHGKSLHYVETHAGAGRYHLGPQGEWREGIGRLLEAEDIDQAPMAVRRYLELLDARPSRKGVRYLGSPLLAARALQGTDAGATLFETHAESAVHLRTAMTPYEAVSVSETDGVAALAQGFRSLKNDLVTVLCDPPWTAKAEWTQVPDALIAAAKHRPSSSFLLWYPVKSLTRPNAMMERIKAQGVGAVVVELSTAPTLVSRGRLVGSGLVMVRPPDGVVDELAGVCAWLGPRLAHAPGAWSMRVTSWVPPADGRARAQL
ncbi:MAG: 23S rRNA (adenine(2030)-N(6))-methyltransferase RlmJ [Myxococcota bacterium]